MHRNVIQVIVLTLLTLLALSISLFAATPAIPAAAQDDLAPPERVELEAADGLALVGLYYAPPDAGADDAAATAPAVVLLHQLNSMKEAWGDVAPAIQAAGYGVLAVDMRGHGETGGAQDWPQAETDLQAWIDWLRDQPGINADGVSLVGASIGSNLALRGMANDPAIVTAVALSPGLDYRGVTTEDAITTIGDRPVFLVAGRGDGYSAETVMALLGQAAGETQARFFPHSAHGTGIFMLEDDLAPAILRWLDVHH